MFLGILDNNCYAFFSLFFVGMALWRREVKKLLADKLAQVNQKINQEPYIEGKHDCRNFAEEKYQELIKDGYKPSEMRFVITEYKGRPHVVLNVNGVILDNNYPPYYATKNLQGGVTYETWKYYRNI